MNDVERLHSDLTRRFPDLRIEIDPSETETGSWFVSVSRAGGLAPVVVEWRLDGGFGLSTPGPDDFGAGVDETYPDARSTFDRVVRLVLSGGKSSPPTAVRLMELRQAAGLSQAELARRLGSSQASVSKAEGRIDMQISTLYRLVQAMGGTISIRARLPGGTVRVLNITGIPTRTQVPSTVPGSSVGQRKQADKLKKPADRAVTPGGGTSKSAFLKARGGRGKTHEPDATPQDRPNAESGPPEHLPPKCPPRRKKKSGRKLSPHARLTEK